MKDIENAYLAEQEYIEKNLGKEVDLLSLLQPFGYNTLEEYFGDKFLYLLKQQNIKIEHCTVDGLRDNMADCFATGKAGAFCPDENLTWAWVGQNDFNYEKAKELGVYACCLNHRGGTIITDNNDVNITINLPSTMNTYPIKFLEQFNNYLCEKGYNTHIDHNDILLEDGRKIAGSAFSSNKLSGNFSISIALSDHTELIKQLCTKQSGKEPWYLTGITKQEIEEEIDKWLQRI